MAKKDEEFRRPKKGEKGKPPRKIRSDHRAEPAKAKPKADKVSNVVQAASTIKHRNAYNKYRTDVIPSGGPVLSFEEWKRSNGIAPPVRK